MTLFFVFANIIEFNIMIKVLSGRVDTYEALFFTYNIEKTFYIFFRKPNKDTYGLSYDLLNLFHKHKQYI